MQIANSIPRSRLGSTPIGRSFLSAVVEHSSAMSWLDTSILPNCDDSFSFSMASSQRAHSQGTKRVASLLVLGLVLDA
eukprot:scaffold6200_cov118-Cylindrotheca_fusiformis.AAC.10